MVKISDEVLAFELDQPRHATSLQISCFLQINTGYSKVGSRLYQFDPQRPPLLFPRWRLHICFCHVIFSFLLYASYAPLSSFVHSSSKNSKKRKTIPISYRQLLNFFLFSYYDTCIVCTIQTAHLSRRRKFIYMPVRMKGEKFTRCIKIYIRVSSWGHSTNEKSPDQFSNFPSTTTFPSTPTTK